MEGLSASICLLNKLRNFEIGIEEFSDNSGPDVLSGFGYLTMHTLAGTIRYNSIIEEISTYP